MRAALALALIAGALLPAAAQAGTVVVRANATPSTDAAWTATPGGARADTVLGDAVTQPAAPSTAGDLLTAGTGNGAYVWMTFPAPSLPAGTAPTAVTLWYYGQVGAAQMLTSSLWDGSSLLGSSSFNAWQSLGWHSFTLSQTPSASALAQLRLALRTDGTAGWPTTTKLYAAYLAIDVPGTTAAPAAPASPEAAPAPDAPAAAAAPAETRPVTLPPGAAALGKVPAAVAPGVGITSPATIELPAQPRSVPVELSCAAGAAGSCTGHVRIELLGAAPAKRSQARAARCARGCRVIGEAKFDIAAGKRKPIKIAMRPTAVRLLPRGRSVRALLTVTSRDRTHAATTTTRVITLSRSLK